MARAAAEVAAEAGIRMARCSPCVRASQRTRRAGGAFEGKRPGRWSGLAGFGSLVLSSDCLIVTQGDSASSIAAGYVVVFAAGGIGIGRVVSEAG